MKRDRLTTVFLSLLLVGLPACDITIEDGSGDDETEGSADSGDDDDDDDDDSGNESGGESGGGSSAGSSAESGAESGVGETGVGETGFGETGFGETGVSETGFGEETTGGFETGMGGFCDDEPTCQDCYDCAVSPGGGCNDVALLCADNPECVEMTFCYDECALAGTQKEYEACLIECEIAWPDGVEPFIALLECTFGLECVTSCAG